MSQAGQTGLELGFILNASRDRRDAARPPRTAPAIAAKGNGCNDGSIPRDPAGLPYSRPRSLGLHIRPLGLCSGFADRRLSVFVIGYSPRWEQFIGPHLGYRPANSPPRWQAQVTVPVVADWGRFLWNGRESNRPPTEAASMISYVRVRDPGRSLVPFGWIDSAIPLRCRPIHT
jgi:hypothetical protein